MFQSNILKVVILLCLASQVFNEETSNPPGFGMYFGNVEKEKVEKCAEEVGLSTEDLMKRKDRKDAKPTEEDLCMDKCVAISLGFIKNGKLDLDFIKAKFPSELKNNMEKIIACLETIQSISDCKDMLKVGECAFNKH